MTRKIKPRKKRSRPFFLPRFTRLKLQITLAAKWMGYENQNCRPGYHWAIQW